MFKLQTNVIHGVFRQGQHERYTRERVEPTSSIVKWLYKDGNEANFDTVNGRGYCWLCRDYQDRSKTRQKRAAYQLFRPVFFLGPVLHQCNQLLWRQRLPGYRQVR
ncbi:hypothetical protein EMIT0357P_10002 [Pseudomonas marginalis]